MIIRKNCHLENLNFFDEHGGFFPSGLARYKKTSFSKNLSKFIYFALGFKS